MALTVQFVDVFGAAPLSGNPLAVVAGGDALDTAAMLRLARWFNLSETAFLLPPTHPEADYRVRIFALDRELPFAGHPTLGSCHAWLAGGHTPRLPGRIVQECGTGLVAVRQDAQRLAFAAPPLVRSGAPSPAELRDALALLAIEASNVVDAAWVDNGPGWLGIRLASAERVRALAPAHRWPRPIAVGAVGPHPPGSAEAVEVRAFFRDHLGTVFEDPVTGSPQASLAQWLFATGAMAGDYVAAQGGCIGRQGRVHVQRDGDGQVWIGGQTRTHVEGRLHGL